jgi:hypothetical protein
MTGVGPSLETCTSDMLVVFSCVCMLVLVCCNVLSSSCAAHMDTEHGPRVMHTCGGQVSGLWCLWTDTRKDNMPGLSKSITVMSGTA